MIGTLELQLFDDTAFKSEPTVDTKSALDIAIDHFMIHVDLDPTDEGYVVDENGHVLNLYVREFSPERWGQDADTFELRCIDRKLGEIDEAFVYGASYLLSLLDGSARAVK